MLKRILSVLITLSVLMGSLTVLASDTTERKIPEGVAIGKAQLISKEALIENLKEEYERRIRERAEGRADLLDIGNLLTESPRTFGKPLLSGGLTEPFTSGQPQTDVTLLTLTDGDYEYIVNDDDDTVTITKYIGSDEDVTIPDEIDGKSVTAIGSMAFYYCRNLYSVTIPDSITSIGYMAFYRCRELSSVTIGSGVTSIGDYAFAYCDYLDNVIIPNGVTSIGNNAFTSCKYLSSVDIPDSVTSIGDRVFVSCTSLTDINVDIENAYYSSVDGILFNKDKSILITYPAGKTDATYVIPNSVTSIGDMAFYYCQNLESITISGGVISIGDNAFTSCRSLTSVAIPDSVTNIGEEAFYRCRELSSVTIGSGVTSIGDYVFYICTSLADINVDDENAYYSSIDGVLFNKDKSVLITYPSGKTNVTYIVPDSVISIGEEAFSFCTSLTTITIPDSVTNIGDRAFSYCTSLADINVDDENAYYSSIDGVLFGKDKSFLITYPSGKTDAAYIVPDGVESVGGWSFAECMYLASVTIPNGVTSIGDHAFTFCESLASVIIPDSVISIGDSAFAACGSLGIVTMGNGVENIGDDAFYNCTSLASVIIPDSVISIGDYAFAFCFDLSNVTIGSGVTSIGDWAFDSCESLASAYFKGSAPTEFGWGAFDDTAPDFTIYYPSTATGWSTPEWNGYPAEPYDDGPQTPEPIVGYTWKAYDLPEGYVIDSDTGNITGVCDTADTYKALVIAKKNDDPSKQMLIEITIAVS